jgi:hypothetical protein
MKKLLFLFLLSAMFGFSQGKLDQAKQNLSSRSSSSSTSSTSTSSSSNNSSNTTGFFKSILADVFVEVFLFLSYEALLGGFESRYFTPYPYYYTNVKGQYDYGIEPGDKRSFLNAGGSYFTGNSIHAIEAHVNYRFDPLLGLELSHRHFFESNLAGKDNLELSSLMFNYYRIRERSVTGWWGIGATYMGNEVNTVGFAYQVGIEVYPVRPISLQASFKKSFINESNINELKFHLKYHRKKVAYSMGYQDFSIGGVNASGVVLGVELGF